MDDLGRIDLHKTQNPAGQAGASGDAGTRSAYGVNAGAELVADLIAATGLLTPDRLAQVRGRAAQSRTSFSQALLDEGLASEEGLARLLATRHALPYVELAATEVDDEVARDIPLHVLERVTALPYALRDGVLHIAIADPGDIRAIDELKLATRHPLSLSVAARDEIVERVKKLVRASEAFGARAAVEEDQDLLVEDRETVDLEEDDGISDAPLVRLVNSIIFQAAEDGASDIHFEPQEDSLVVRFRVDGV